MARAKAAMVLAIGGALTLSACGGGSGSPTSSNGGSGSSGSGGSSSHNAGRNCLQCHSFGAAGTVYRSGGSSTNSAATVRITTAANGGGTVVATLRTDGSGNFYTSQAVAYGSGLYVDLAGASGGSAAMKSPVTSGACNSCHGASTGKLIVD